MIWKWIFIFAWIALTAPMTDDPVYISTTGIVAIHRTFKSITEGATIVFLSGGNSIYVKEPINAVWEKIKKADGVKDEEESSKEVKPSLHLK